MPNDDHATAPASKAHAPPESLTLTVPPGLADAVRGWLAALRPPASDTTPRR